MNSFDLFKGQFSPDFSWNISGVTELVKEKNFKIKSPVFALVGYPDIRAQVILQLKVGDEVYLSLSLNEHNVGSPSLDSLKLIPTVNYLLKDRSGKQNIVHSCSYLFDSRFDDFYNYEELLVHKSFLTNPSYNADDSVVLEVYAEPPALAQQVHSYDGSLHWAVDNFSKRKQVENEGLMEFQDSPYFYTGPRGYRVRAKMWLTGLGDFEDLGVTVSICFVTGEFDEDLPKNFAHRTTVTLMDRKHPERSVTKTVNQNIKEDQEYDVDMCVNEDVGRLIENDTLFCSVMIKSH